MKEKIKKIIKGYLPGFITGIIVCGTVSVLAMTYFPSSQTTYNNSNSGMQVTDVQGAIDELYNVCFPPKTGEDINNLKYKYVYQLNLNENPYEDILEDDIVLYGLKTQKIYNSNRHTLIKLLELYRNLYYNEGNTEDEVIWYTMLTARTFSELYELASKVLDEEKVQRLMEGVIRMSQDEFIIHEWQKEKMDALVKLNEMEGAKKEGLDEGKALGIEEGRSIGLEEGKSIGIKEKAKEIAQNLLNKKMSIEDISEVTGLTIKEIEKIRSTNE